MGVEIWKRMEVIRDQKEVIEEAKVES